MPVSIPITRTTPSPEGQSARRVEGRGEGKSPSPEVGVQEGIKEIIVPFSTLINFRPTSPQSEEEELEEGQAEGLGEGIVRVQLNSLSHKGEGRGEGL